ncbi:MAG: DUF924 domain-containing protein [Fischerella sp.]|jgi:uncharacterized protein (DUF924 family)|uniref:DUF924 family protein n=1 Tax=Fischerella sp. TaxID=1191 RepID=UPI00184890FB|nr:DUF924 family protein [Fischerella sp.]NWF58787.1 DUF924 domain-containing protein [Fischerella sp.]
MSQAQEILDFWFGKPDQADYGKPRDFWFTKKPEFDEQVRTRFLKDYQKAAEGYLEDWIEFPDTCLALILLLDQFPRNMFRGTPEAFATDWEALSTAHHAIAKGYDRKLLAVQRWFIYLPFEHSENLEDQRRAVKLFQQLSDDPDSASCIDYAIRHMEVIERFGRFPHRNAILGRTSTSEEKEFLKQSGSRF